MSRVEVYLNYFLLVPTILNATSVWLLMKKRGFSIKNSIIVRMRLFAGQRIKGELRRVEVKLDN